MTAALFPAAAVALVLVALGGMALMLVFSIADEWRKPETLRPTTAHMLNGGTVLGVVVIVAVFVILWAAAW